MKTLNFNQLEYSGKHYLLKVRKVLNRKKIDVPLNQSLLVGPPTNVILVTCVSAENKPNIITIGMYMPISHNPPLITIGISPRRYSCKIIEESKEFVINVPTKDLVKQAIFCGSVSGKDHDKFKEAKITPIPANKVKPPLIKECVSNLECKVVSSYICGDHILFIGEVLAAHVNNFFFNESLDVLKAETINHKKGRYFIPKLILEECSKS
jgi:flavin reductase (DIM6/NTAB) family NADH-FMN oxidoreductase RutF